MHFYGAHYEVNGFHMHQRKGAEGDPLRDVVYSVCARQVTCLAFHFPVMNDATTFKRVYSLKRSV